MEMTLPAWAIAFGALIVAFFKDKVVNLVLELFWNPLWNPFWRKFKGNVCVRQVLAVLHLLPADFPETLGPMRLLDVPGVTRLYAPRRHENGDSAETGHTWHIPDFKLFEETGIASHDRAINMHLTEEAELRFGTIRRKNLGIPEKAVSFRWCYPCGRTKLDLDANNDDHLAVACLLQGGGWMFFDQDHWLLAVKTVTPAKDDAADTLDFEKHVWRQEWTEGLRDRFQKTNLRFIREAGAKYYVWLKPNERVGHGSRQPVVPHGGFAYLFHAPDEPGSKLDCYFAVKPFSCFPTLHDQHRQTDGDPRVRYIENQVRFYLSRSQHGPSRGDWLEIRTLKDASCMRRSGATSACIIEAVKRSRSTELEVDREERHVRWRPPRAGSPMLAPQAALA